MLVTSMTQLIGQTPIIHIQSLSQSLKRDVYVKLEWFNPGGSVKDRIAFSMVEAAIKEGLLSPGQTIIEPTSGNTGIGLALVAAAKGHPLVITMPESVSIERRKILKAYGVTLIITPADKGMKGAIAKAESLASKHGYFMPMQFDNLHNPAIHMRTTAEEILADLNPLDALVVGVGTGGTITGVGTILKARLKHLKIVAVEPKDSAVLSGNNPGPHKLQGIGAGFVPSILKRDLIDDIVQVGTEDAFSTIRSLMKTEGLFGGISTGANIFAAIQVAKSLPEGSKVLTFAPSNGERYLSTALFEESSDSPVISYL